MTAEPLSGTERAIFGDLATDQVLALLDTYARQRLGSRIANVDFRAGRIDAVWGITLQDRRELVIKAHRAPVDFPACVAATTAQHVLVDAGFPAPTPIFGPDRFGDLVLSAETRMPAGQPVNGLDPAVRSLVAAELARHIDLLRTHPDLADGAGQGPAWCRYTDGPWPTPHDPIFDFTTTPTTFRWLDDIARTSAAQITTNRTGAVVVGHADWYIGNLAIDDGHLVGSFDWDLTTDTEPVIAGFSAGCFAASATAGHGLSTPAEIAAFLHDYETARGTAFSRAEQQAATGAATWTLAYNARCELSLLNGPPAPDASLTLLHTHPQYLDITW